MDMQTFSQWKEAHHLSEGVRDTIVYLLLLLVGIPAVVLVTRFIVDTIFRLFI